MPTRHSSPTSSSRIAGLILLLVAAVALLERYTTVQLGVVAPGLLGGIFIGCAVFLRQPAWLIPGGILLGVGAGLLAERFVSAGAAVDRALFMLCLGGGFALVTLLSKLIFRQTVRWPLIPATILGALGLFHLAGTELRHGLRLLQQIWPFVALAVAAWLLFAPRRNR